MNQAATNRYRIIVIHSSWIWNSMDMLKIVRKRYITLPNDFLMVLICYDMFYRYQRAFLLIFLKTFEHLLQIIKKTWKKYSATRSTILFLIHYYRSFFKLQDCVSTLQKMFSMKIFMQLATWAPHIMLRPQHRLLTLSGNENLVSKSMLV